jgi:hypothetical protein
MLGHSSRRKPLQQCALEDSLEEILQGKELDGAKKERADGESSNRREVRAGGLLQ